MNHIPVNSLAPIQRASSGFGLWEPTLINHGSKHRKLPTFGWSFRPDLDGLVQEQNGCPVISIDERGSYLVLNARPSIVDAWLSTIAQGGAR